MMTERPLFSLCALCPAGAEKILRNELRKLALISGEPFQLEEGRFGQVRCATTLRGIYLALSGLRCADRLLAVCARFAARDFDELFEGVRAAPLEAFIPRTMPLVIEKVRANRSALAAETSIQAVAHKAAAERLCTAWGLARLPEPDGIREHSAALRVYIEKDTAELLLDLSGEPLSRRGYRTEGGTAPLRETAAAAVLLGSGWKRKHPLYDPFCGSGTIAIEAALYAHNIAPGLTRRFALDSLLIASAPLEDEVRAFWTSRIDTTHPVRITGSDTDGALVSAAQRNFKRAFAAVPHAPPASFFVCGAEEARGFDDDGFVVTNPPYGLRLGERAEAEANYRAMPVLTRNFRGWKIVVISDNEGFESFFGSRASLCREIICGALKLFVFEFSGGALRSARVETERTPARPRSEHHNRAQTERPQSERHNRAQTERPRPHANWTW